MPAVMNVMTYLLRSWYMQESLASSYVHYTTMLIGSEGGIPRYSPGNSVAPPPGCTFAFFAAYFPQRELFYVETMYTLPLGTTPEGTPKDPYSTSSLGDCFSLA